MEQLSILAIVVGLGVAGFSVARSLYRINTSSSFRVTNPDSGKSVTVTSRFDSKKLAELVSE